MNEAVQLYDSQLSVVTTPRPKVTNQAEVLIKVAYAGVCGTDLHILHGEFPSSKSAVVLGHEFCGIAEQVGSEVSHIKAGSRVVVNPNSCCGSCRYCTRGNPHFCKTGGIRSTVGIWKNGGWARYCKVQGILVHPLPDNIPFEIGVLCEPMSCIARGWQQLGTVLSDSDIVVCGAGIVGLLWASLFHFKGFKEFVVTEIAEKRRNAACDLNLGIKVIHPENMMNQWRDAQRTKNDDWGYDIVVDCTGSPKAIEDEFKWLRRGGKLLLFGCCPQNSELRIDPFEVYNKEIMIIGSHINPYTFPKAIQLVSDMSEKYLSFDKLCVRKYQLQDYPNALEALKKAEIAKAVFEVHRDEELEE